MKGSIFVISAPSGTGKTTVIKRLLEDVKNLVLAVSYTTRSPRPGEVGGRDYTFVDEDRFNKMIASNGFAEWAEVHGKMYGTPKKDIDSAVASGRDALLDIDTEGASKVKKRYPEAVLIFLLPPSFEELEKRLRGRASDGEEEIEKRISNAKGELGRRHEYDYQVVNESVDEAVGEIKEIIDYYRSEQ